MVLLRNGVGRQHLTHTLPESDSQSVLFAVATDDDLVKVLEEFSGLTTRKLQCFGALPAEL